MCRYIERDNIMFLAVDLKWGRVIALVAVKDQQLAPSYRTRYCYDFDHSATHSAVTKERTEQL